MAALHAFAFTFLAVTLLGGGLSLSDEEFEDLPPLVAKVFRKMNEEIQEQASEIAYLKLKLSEHDSTMREPFQTDAARNSSLEERVTLLEVQVADITEDLTTTDENVADLDQDVNFLFDEQVIQDERIFLLETTTDQVTIELARINEDVEDLEATSVDLDTRVTVLEENGGGDGNSSVAELEVRVETLEGTVADHETRLTAMEENIEGLMMTDVDLDRRITALEENASFQNDTIAFHAVLTSYSSITGGAPAIFNEVLLNEGDGYDSTTGVFTVPPGGDGLYYFSTYLQVADGEFARFEIRVNNEDICVAEGDQDNNGSGDNTQAACSGVVDLVEGDEVSVVLNLSTNTTPILESTSLYWNGFNGFQI